MLVKSELKSLLITQWSIMQMVYYINNYICLTNRMWFRVSVLLSPKSMCHHSGVNVADSGGTPDSTTNFDHCDDAYSLSIMFT